MADYAIYGNCSDKNQTLLVLNESDWSVEHSLSSMPLYDPTDDNGEYWVECVSGTKTVVSKRPDGTIDAEGNVEAVLYWTDISSDSYWEEDPDNAGGDEDMDWAENSWFIHNYDSVERTYFLRALGDWNTTAPHGRHIKMDISSGGGEWNDLSSVGCISFVGSGGYVQNNVSSKIYTREDVLSDIYDQDEYFYKIGITVPAGESRYIQNINISSQAYSNTITPEVPASDCAGWNTDELAITNVSTVIPDGGSRAPLVCEDKYIALNLASVSAGHNLQFNASSTDGAFTMYYYELEGGGEGGASWDNRTNTTYFAATTGSWDGEDSRWNASNPGGEGEWTVSLNANLGSGEGSWKSGYRPTKMRLIFSGSAPSLNVSLKDNTNTYTLGSDASANSYEEILINFGGEGTDLNYLTATSPWQFYINTIEFSTDAGETWTVKNTWAANGGEGTWSVSNKTVTANTINNKIVLLDTGATVENFITVNYDNLNVGGGEE